MFQMSNFRVTLSNLTCSTLIGGWINELVWDVLGFTNINKIPKFNMVQIFNILEGLSLEIHFCPKSDFV